MITNGLEVLVTSTTKILSKFLKKKKKKKNNSKKKKKKKKRLPHNRVTSKAKATKLLDVIHSNIIGPFPDSILWYLNSSLLFIDEFSGKAWIFFTMKKKKKNFFM